MGTVRSWRVYICRFQLYGDINSEFDWEELIFVAGSESPCKPAGTLCTWKVRLEGTLFRCEFYTQKKDSELCDQLVDLMNYFDLLWDEVEKVILSVDDFPGVFPREWLPPAVVLYGCIRGFQSSL